MFLTQLELQHFRHFDHYSLAPSPTCNVILGANGSGKSSILEAIYLLAMGRSFRNTQLSALIQHEAPAFQVVGHWQNDFERHIAIGFAKKRQHSGNDIHVDGRAIHGLSELVRLVPLQLIHHESFHLLDAGPQSRREFLDWGVFHSEPCFYPAWQRYQRALKQRNAALKRQQALSELCLWDQELTLQADVIHQLRQAYLHALLPHFESLLAKLLPIDSLHIQYLPGWDVELSLQTILERHYARDRQLGYSQHGPHRADLKVKWHQHDADHVLSRGQQKLVSYALRLAQSQLLRDNCGKRVVLLIDDLPAELDAQKIDQAMQLLLDLRCQLFITAVDDRLLLQACERASNQTFHVERLAQA